jgi:pantoate--beta-alanine ligase
VVDYFDIRDADDLKAPRDDSDQLVIAVAAKLGNTRLIDNTTVDIGNP